MSTYLELCKWFTREVGLQSGGLVPTTVLNQTGELAKVVQYVADADMDIRRRWFNWNFLWKEFVANTQIGSMSLDNSPDDLGVWRENSFVYAATTDDFQHLCYKDYFTWQDQINVGTHENGTPDTVTIKPDRSVLVYPPADAVQTVRAEYWKRPTAMAVDDATSDIPIEFERIIIVRAKIIYAEAEDAPEIMLGAAAEFDDILGQLEAHELPDQKVRHMSRATVPIQIRVV